MINLKKVESVAHEKYDQCLVLNCTDIPRHHWILDGNDFEIRLNVNQAVLEPSILIRGKRMFIGAEQGIFVYDMAIGELVNKVHDVSNVQWIESDASEYIIFAAEDEVIALNNLGVFLWRANFPDVIEMTSVINESLTVSVMTGEKYTMRLVDGSS